MHDLNALVRVRDYYFTGGYRMHGRPDNSMVLVGHRIQVTRCALGKTCCEYQLYRPRWQTSSVLSTGTPNLLDSGSNKSCWDRNSVQNVFKGLEGYLGAEGGVEMISRESTGYHGGEGSLPGY